MTDLAPAELRIYRFLFPEIQKQNDFIRSLQLQLFFFLFNDRYSGIFLNAFYFIIFRWSPQNFAFKQQKKFFFVQLFFSPLAPYALLWSAFLSLGSQLFSFVASVTPENLYRLKLIFTTKPQLLLNIQRCNWKKPFLLLQLFEQLLACETFQSCLSF